MTSGEIALAVIAYLLTGAVVGGYLVATSRRDGIDEGWETVYSSLFLWPIALAVLIGVKIAELRRSR